MIYKQLQNFSFSRILNTAIVLIFSFFTISCNNEDNSNNLHQKDTDKDIENQIVTPKSKEIKDLTNETVVIRYVKAHKKLPDYYITKAEAQKLGWVSKERNLCDVAPGKAIGGDVFGNREGLLPKNESYFEADLNYNCASRGTDRIVFTKKGDVYLTKDHYKSFKKQ